jgi:hypothetical protein
VSPGFFPWHLTVPCALGVDSASKNEYQVNPGSKGGRCIRLTTYHHTVPLSSNLGALTNPRPLWVCMTVTGVLYYCLQQKCDSWFQNFAVFWMVYAFLWVIPRRLNFICRRFGTLSVPSSMAGRYEDGTECSETSAYKIHTPGITQKKAYKKCGILLSCSLFPEVSLRLTEYKRLQPWLHNDDVVARNIHTTNLKIFSMATPSIWAVFVSTDSVLSEKVETAISTKILLDYLITTMDHT